MPMPATVADVFAAADLKPADAVRWGTPVPVLGPGNYVVALTEDPDSTIGALADAPLDRVALTHLLDIRPELRLDGHRPTVDELVARLNAFWLPEPVLYIGLGGTSLRQRVRQYYKTPLGARRPHAGGWWLKTLTVVDEVWVHYAATEDDADAEEAMLKRFAHLLAPESQPLLHDPGNPAPFANLRTGCGDNKNHGITGATGDLPDSAAATANQGASPRRRSSQTGQRTAGAGPPFKVDSGSGVGHQLSQTVTAKDLQSGRIRFPRQAKRLFPADRAYVTAVLRGREFDGVRWDPQVGPDKERSGLLTFGKGKLDGIVSVGEVLGVGRGAGGDVVLR